MDLKTSAGRALHHVQSFGLSGINKGLCVGNHIIGERTKNNVWEIAQQGARSVIGVPLGLIAAATLGVGGGVLGVGWAVGTGALNLFSSQKEEDKTKDDAFNKKYLKAQWNVTKARFDITPLNQKSKIKEATDALNGLKKDVGKGEVVDEESQDDKPLAEDSVEYLSKDTKKNITKIKKALGISDNNFTTLADYKKVVDALAQRLEEANNDYKTKAVNYYRDKINANKNENENENIFSDTKTNLTASHIEGTNGKTEYWIKDKNNLYHHDKKNDNSSVFEVVSDDDLKASVYKDLSDKNATIVGTFNYYKIKDEYKDAILDIKTYSQIEKAYEISKDMPSINSNNYDTYIKKIEDFFPINDNRQAVLDNLKKIIDISTTDLSVREKVTNILTKIIKLANADMQNRDNSQHSIITDLITAGLVKKGKGKASNATDLYEFSVPK